MTETTNLTNPTHGATAPRQHDAMTSLPQPHIEQDPTLALSENPTNIL